LQGLQRRDEELLRPSRTRSTKRAMQAHAVVAMCLPRASGVTSVFFSGSPLAKKVLQEDVVSACGCAMYLFWAQAFLVHKQLFGEFWWPILQKCPSKYQWYQTRSLFIQRV
jgi:hypothetical protein